MQGSIESFTVVVGEGVRFNLRISGVEKEEDVSPEAGSVRHWGDAEKTTLHMSTPIVPFAECAPLAAALIAGESHEALWKGSEVTWDDSLPRTGECLAMLIPR